MAAAQAVYSVGSIGQALELADKFSDVLGFMVAPLQVESGGQRKWHGLDPEDRSRWMPESEANDAKEPQIPHPDNGSDGLPPLPASKISVWEVCFIDKDLNRLRPRVRIQEKRAEPEVEASAPPPSANAAQAASCPQLGESTLLGLIREQHRFSMECLRANKDMLSTVSDHQKRLTQELQTELEKANARAAEADRVRDMALGANTELHHKLAALESDNLIATTVQKVFEGKPELLVATLKEAISGVFEAVRKSA